MKAPSELDVSSGGRELHMPKLAPVPDSRGTALGLQQPFGSSAMSQLQINNCYRVRNAAPSTGRDYFCCSTGNKFHLQLSFSISSLMARRKHDG